jgi:hypothetical protein
VKNENIHETLEDKEVRDFLGKNIGNSYQAEVNFLETALVIDS